MLSKRRGLINLFVAKSGIRLTGERNPGELFNDAELERGDPELTWLYLYALGPAWLVLGLVSAIVLTGVEVLAGSVGGREGTLLSVGLLNFVTGFCFVGGLDAFVRFCFVHQARHRYRSNGGILDRDVRRLMSVAQVRDQATLLFQCAGAIAAVFILK